MADKAVAIADLGLGDKVDSGVPFLKELVVLVFMYPPQGHMCGPWGGGYVDVFGCECSHMSGMCGAIADMFKRM